MSKPTKKSVRSWMLLVMARMRAFVGENAAQECEAAVSLSLDALIMRFPDASVFCQSSLDHVATTERFWNEAAVVKSLDKWVSSQAPASQELPPEAEAAPISRMGKLLYRDFLTASDDFAAINVLGRMRDMEPDAFDWVVRHDHSAAGYAVRKAWRPTPTEHELASEWDDEAFVIRTARAIRSMERTTPWNASLQNIALNTFLSCVAFHAKQHFETAKWELSRYPDQTVMDAVPVAFPALSGPPAVEITNGLFD